MNQETLNEIIEKATEGPYPKFLQKITDISPRHMEFECNIDYPGRTANNAGSADIAIATLQVNNAFASYLAMTGAGEQESIALEEFYKRKRGHKEVGPYRFRNPLPQRETVKVTARLNKAYENNGKMRYSFSLDFNNQSCIVNNVEYVLFPADQSESEKQ